MVDRVGVWWLYWTLISLMCFSGAVSNIYFYAIGGDGINVGTYLVFFAALLSLGLGLSDFPSIVRGVAGRRMMLLIACGFILGGYYQLGFSRESIVAFKATLSFFFLPVSAMGAYVLCRRYPAQFFRLLLILGGLLAAVGLFQFLLGMSVPSGWQVLHGEELLSFWSLGWVRPTAWVGNSIFFSCLMFLMFVLAFQCFLLLGSGLAGLTSLLTASAIYVAMSRYTIAMSLGVAILFVLWWLFASGKICWRRLIIFVLSSGLLMIALNYYNGFGVGAPDKALAQSQSSSSLVFDRFRPSSTHSQGSNETHALETREAVRYILGDHEWTGWGSQGISASNSIISDGLWFQFAIELGAINALLFVGWLFVILFMLILALLNAYRCGVFSKVVRENEYAFIGVLGVTLVSYLGYSLLGGFINSSFAGRVSYSLFWVMVGCFFGMLDRHKDFGLGNE